MAYITSSRYLPESKCYGDQVRILLPSNPRNGQRYPTQSNSTCTFAVAGGDKSHISEEFLNLRIFQDHCAAGLITEKAYTNAYERMKTRTSSDVQESSVQGENRPDSPQQSSPNSRNSNKSTSAGTRATKGAARVLESNVSTPGGHSQTNSESSQTLPNVYNIESEKVC